MADIVDATVTAIKLPYTIFRELRHVVKGQKEKRNRKRLRRVRSASGTSTSSSESITDQYHHPALCAACSGSSTDSIQTRLHASSISLSHIHQRHGSGDSCGANLALPFYTPSEPSAPEEGDLPPSYEESQREHRL